MRLIDADEMKECLCGWDRSLVKLVDMVPTAYDIDKVVEQIKNDTTFYEGKYLSFVSKRKAIEIIKAGARNEERTVCTQGAKRNDENKISSECETNM